MLKINVKSMMYWIIPVVLSVGVFIGYPYIVKPVHEVHTSYADVSLEDDIAFSDMIIYGEIIGQRIVPDPEDRKSKKIEYSLKPIEVFQDVYGHATGTVRMLSYTGIYPNKIVKHERSPILRIGNTALFFVRYSEENSVYYYGDSLMKSETGALYPHADAEVSSTLGGQIAQGYATAERLRELILQVPYGDLETRRVWANSFRPAPINEASTSEEE